MPLTAKATHRTEDLTIDALRADLKFALGSFRRARGFALAAVLTFALGIAGSSTIFAVVNGVVLKPLPFPDSERLVWLAVSVNIFPDAQMGLSPGMLTRAQAMPDVLDHAAIYSTQPRRRTLTGQGDPERVTVQPASGDFFRVLGVSPVAGRAFAISDVDPDSSDGAVLVLSHAFWARRFGADPRVIGRTIVLDERPYVVIGVMPQAFTFPGPEVEAWSALPLSDRYGGYGWKGIARLHSDVHLQEAEARLNGMVPRLPALFPESRIARSAVDRETRLHVIPLKRVIVFDSLRRVLWIVFGAMAFVLLMACVNVVGLFLARGEARRHEMAVRSALGAGNERLARHLLAEGVTLASVGGLIGMAVCIVAVEFVRHFGPVELPRLPEVGVDSTVVAFAVMVTLISGSAFGLAGLGFRSSATADILSARGLGGSAGRARISRAMVASQMAFALVLLIGAGLMVRSFRNLTNVDPGFDATNVLTFDVRLDSSYPGRANQVSLQNALTERLSGLPSVSRVAAASCIPLRDRCSGGTNLRERRVVALLDPPPVIPSARATVTPGYFEAMRVPLLQGRPFMPGADDSLSVILSASLAHDRWPGEDPIGRVVSLGDWSDPEPSRWYTVVGVVGDLPVSMNLGPLPSELTRVVYFPPSAMAADLRTMTLVLRSAIPPLDLVGAVRETVWTVDSDLPIDRVATMKEYVREARAPMAFFMSLVVIGASAALLLGLVGVFGVVAQTVGRRTGEIGVRMALGATASQVVLMVVRDGTKVAAAGAAIGLVGALALNRVTGAVVFGVSPTDPATYLAAFVGLLTLAATCTYLPARRAARVDPVEALREG